MTRKLEELFDLPTVDNEVLVSEEDTQIQISENQQTIQHVNETIDKIDAALPAVKSLDTGDDEMDELAAAAKESFDELMALGMNVEPRHSGKLFEVASSLLGHAITAKTAKLDKKIKMIELQLKKAKLDKDAGKTEDPAEGQGTVLDRNALLEQILNKGNEDKS